MKRTTESFSAGLFRLVRTRSEDKEARLSVRIYTIWNYRREALQPVFEAGGEAAAAASEAELALTQTCLTENPKSYSTWHHRKWVVLQGLADLQREMKLVNTALAVDGRNFHAWNYRQFIVKLMGLSTEAELAYSTSLIAADFSNYSAWHYRTLLLPRLHNEDITTVSFDELMQSAAAKQQQQQPQQQQPPPQQPQPSGTDAAVANAAGCQQEPAQQAAVTQAVQRNEASCTPHNTSLQHSQPAQQQQQQQQQAIGCFKGSASQRRPIPLHVLDQEYDMVHQAFATDSGDESPWIYYRWLLGNSLAHLDQTQQAAAEGSEGSEEAVEEARGVLGEVLAREVSRFSEALAQDPDAKWPLLMTARLKEAQVALGLCELLGLEPQAIRQAVADMYKRLAEVDPMRAGYYADAAAGKAFVVVQALGTV